MVSSSFPHCFYGINKDGIRPIVTTKGNKNTHIRLRGSKWGINYNKEEVNKEVKFY